MMSRRWGEQNMPNDRPRSPPSWGRTAKRRRPGFLAATTALAILSLSISAVAFVASAGATTSSFPGSNTSRAAPNGGRIEDGSEWTLFSEAVFQGGCTVVTFSARPNVVDDDIGDQGTWNGGKTSVALHFLTGAESHPYGLAPGAFHGTFAKESGFFAGSFRPTKPRGGPNTASLVPGADPDC